MENPISLQEQKLQNEVDLQNLEKKLKQKELRRWALLSPTMVTILVALVGLIGTGVTSVLQRNSQLTIEENKFHYSIYQKALDAPDNTTAAQILDFYIAAGLLPGEKGQYSKLVEEGKTNEVPLYSGLYEGVVVPKTDASNNLVIENHFLKGQGTEYLLSYNARARLEENELTTLVIHSSATNDLKATANFLTDTVTGNASAHIFIDKDGKIIQQVPFNFISHHAGKHNKYSIGIELINMGYVRRKGDEYLDIYDRPIDASRIDCDANGMCWEKYTDLQIETAYKICALLVKNYHITQIVGHNELEKHKLDPGPFFPMERFRGLVGV